MKSLIMVSMLAMASGAAHAADTTMSAALCTNAVGGFSFATRDGPQTIAENWNTVAVQVT